MESQVNLADSEWKLDPNDPERYVKHLQKVLGVSKRIKALVPKKILIADKEETEEQKKEKYEKQLKDAKDGRTRRLVQVGLNQRYLIELFAHCFGIDENILIDCAIDSARNIDVLTSVFERHGEFMVLAQYQLDNSPAIDSGRFIKEQRFKKMDMALFSSGKGKKILGQSFFAYRNLNLRPIESRTVSDEIFFAVLPDEENVISAIYMNLKLTIRPALGASREYGNCTEHQKEDFLHGVDHFLQFLRSTKNDIVSCSLNFKVEHALYKGYLLAPHQVEATSKRPEIVAQVEHDFLMWLKQIKSVVAQGHQIRRDGPEDGPLAELEYWRRMLTIFNNVIEFTDSRPFQNFFRCLKLSRSKLIAEWKRIEDDLITMLNESRDNVRFMTSIEKFWDPLYRCEPLMIVESLRNLLQAIKTVYNSSRFYNTSLRITGFLSKVTNQLIVAAQKFLMKNEKGQGETTIWQKDMNVMVKKIQDCKVLKNSYRQNYENIVQDMIDAGEEPFDCSNNYLFKRLESFNTRLNKIREIMEVMLRYRVLDKVRIAGTEKHSARIKKAFQVISEKDYNPLDYRRTEFDEDYVEFQKEITSVELDLQMFVKACLEQIETAEVRLLTLKRFDKLDLECLALDHRYLDAVVMLEKELEDIRDKYNEERAKPPLGFNIPPIVGRIMWARSLQKKMEGPLNILKSRQCVIVHPKAQLCVKYYNYLTGILLHYEMMHHKAWYTYADQVRRNLDVPLIKKVPEKHYYEINLEPYVLQVVKETESMWKLGLEVPETAQILTFCKQNIFKAYGKIEVLIKRNNALRRSIYPQFVSLIRMHLIKVERAFAPALSTITWLTLNIDDYFQEVADVLLPIESFLREISDINDTQIQLPLQYISRANLVYLPDKAMPPEELYEMNVKHRNTISKKIEEKSLAAERAAVALINKFVDYSGLPTYDDSGKFQVPVDQITKDTNLREEENKPIDIYDWLSFKSLYKPVDYPSKDDLEDYCFRHYEDLHYDMTLLHIDCVEIFAFYNHKIINALLRATKDSMERFKKRSDIRTSYKHYSCQKEREEATIIRVRLDLVHPYFRLFPNITIVQKWYEKIINNIIETHNVVTTWGKQAKTAERKKRVPLKWEIRGERTFFGMIGMHKDVIRSKMNFDGGLMHLAPQLDRIILGLEEQYSYLWADDRNDSIEAFVKADPLTPDIRDTFKLYDETTEAVSQLQSICVGPLFIDFENMSKSLVEESKAWKFALGKRLTSVYGAILNENVDFIHTQQRILSKEIVGLDDCRRIVECLRIVRENFVRIDHNLLLMEKTYAVFNAFNISVKDEDVEKVDGLRYSFYTLKSTVVTVEANVLELQDSLMNELNVGIVQLKQDFERYEKDFTTSGPMTSGISAKEAIDRVVLFKGRFEQIYDLYVTLMNGEKLFGLPISQYPALQLRKKEIDAMKKLHKFCVDVNRMMIQFRDTLLMNADMKLIGNQIQQFADQCHEQPAELSHWFVFIELKHQIDHFAECCPIISLLIAPTIKAVHWERLEGLMSYKFEADGPQLTLGMLLRAPLMSFVDEIKEVCTTAIKEHEKEKAKAKGK